LHIPAFLPIWLKAAFFGVAGAILILPGRFFVHFAGRISRLMSRILESPVSLIVVAAAFVVLRATPALLGDGRLRGREAQAGIVRPVEYLSDWLATKVYELGHPLIAIDGWTAVAVVSIFSGCLFLFFIWYFPRRIWNDSRDRLVARSLLAGSGLVALFFGYVEAYALPCALMTGVLLAAEAFRREKGSFYVVVLLQIMAVAAHVLAVILFPALWSLALTNRTKRGARLTVVAFSMTAGLCWMYFIFFGNVYAKEAAMGRVILPLFAALPTDYGILSPAHLLDLANLPLLVCPGAVIAAVILLACRKNFTKIAGYAFFWSTVIAAGLVFIILLDPKLGMARDWDLFGLGLLPVVVWTAIRMADRRPSLVPGTVMYPIVAQVMTSVVFVGINTHSDTAIARFENLLELDRNRGGYGHEILAGWYHDRGDTEKEILHWREAAILEDNKRYWGGLSLACLQAGDYRSGLAAACRAYARDTSWAKGAFYLASAYRELGQYDSALLYYDRSLCLDPGAHNVRHDLATFYLRFGLYDEGLQQIDAAIALAPDSGVYRGVRGWILFEAGRLEECEKSLRYALKMDPNLVPARVNLSRWFYRTGRADSALLELDRVLRVPDLPIELRDNLLELGRSFRNRPVPSDSAG